MSKIKVLAFVGSIRSKSIHKKLIEADKRLAPEGMHIEFFDIKDIPVYNMDLESHWPTSVLEFKHSIKDADGLIIGVPEHNYSFSGVLKNAIDWASRPLKESPFHRKPVILQSASSGMMGGSRAQYHLRQVLSYLETLQMQFPETFVPKWSEKINEDGDLIDEPTLNHIRKQLIAFQEFILSHT